MVIQEFKVKDIEKYNFSDAVVGSPVFFDHRYNLEDICGKVVHVSIKRGIINVEFTKHHPLHKLLKNIDIRLKLDLVYRDTLSEPSPRTVSAFVVYMAYGYD